MGRELLANTSDSEISPGPKLAQALAQAEGEWRTTILMRFCYQCGKITSGEPLFCASCGQSYDLRVCHRLHPNPRHAKFCSQCGSHDLSTPQPKVPIRWRIFGFLLRLSLGILLSCFTLLLLLAFLSDPQIQGGLIGLGLLLLVLWSLWGQLPAWFRKLVKKALERRRRG